MRFIIEPLLAFFARRIVRKYKPKVIGITGSVGKTSTRAAVYAVVSQKFRSYTPPKNLNDKIGLPLAIIGMDSPGKNAWGWVKVFTRAKLLLLFPMRYPEVLVLEYGIDRVGEMDDLISIAKPDISILTSIGLSHYEFFKNAETIEMEKGKILEALSPDGVAIINADNNKALNQRSKSRARVITYGVEGDIKLQRAEERLVERPSTALHISIGGRTLTATIAALGKAHVSSALAALAVGEALSIEPDLIIKGLMHYKPVPGRLNVLGGLRRSIIIDDTYNAAPDSMHEALALFARFPAAHKIAVIGDMLELGSASDEAHTATGKEIAALAPNHLVTVGPSGRIIAEAALGAGFPDERILSFDSAEIAKTPVRELMREGSVVLVKGSQSIRLEKVTKEIMAEPMKAAELLCRQYGTWMNS